MLNDNFDKIQEEFARSQNFGKALGTGPMIEEVDLDMEYEEEKKETEPVVPLKLLQFR